MLNGFVGGGLTIAATYARVSTRAQEDGISLDQQERAMLEYAERQQVQVPPEYRFREAASGLQDEREEYGKIRQLIRERKINALIVYSTDRHTRDPIHGKIFRAELRRAKATLHVVTKGGLVDIWSAQGELMATVEDAFNKYWLQKILEVTYDKKQEYIREGIPFVQGHARYGYCRVGRKREARAEIVEEQAAVVRRIYNWAEEGHSVYQIDKLLTGTPAPGERMSGKVRKLRHRQDGRWGPVAVLRVLRDEIYAGIYWANREEVYEDENGKKRKQPRPREEWVSIQVPAIVSREQWERVQGILDNARRERPRMHAKYDYLLARRITCGTCHYAATTMPQPQPNGSTRFYYGCTTLKSRALTAPSCGTRRFRVAETDAAVWNKLKEVINDPQTFLAQLREDQAEQRKNVQVDDSELREVLAQIEEGTAELSVLARKQVQAEAQQDTLMAGIYQQQINEMRETVQVLQKRKVTLERRLAHKIISNEEIATIEQLAQWAQPRLAGADHDFQARRKLIEAFNWRFTLLWRDGQRIVVIHWRDWDIEAEVNYPSRK